MKLEVVIPAYKPDDGLKKLIKRLWEQSVRPDGILIMNTEKEAFDRFAAGGDPFAGYGDWVRIIHLTKQEFDHAGTRNRAMENCSADYVLMMTQDAQPAGRELTKNLLECFEDDRVAVAYARQLPRKDAGIIERMAREFNYPGRSEKKGAQDTERLGIKTYFCSDVCAMYRRELFCRLGAFSEPAVFNEDMVFAAKAVKSGYMICYCAEAAVVHSHDYGGLQQLRRNFDNGASQAMHPEVFDGISSENEGIKMIRGQLSRLRRGAHFLQMIRLIWLSGCKYIGFFLGKRFKKLPEGMVKRIGSNKEFWKKYYNGRQEKVCAE